MSTCPCPCDGGNMSEEHSALHEIAPYLRDWYIIGISGVTCGGKTTLANKLMSKLYPAYVFHQDKYFYADGAGEVIPCGPMGHANYDTLEALDMRAMTAGVAAALRGAAGAAGAGAGAAGRAAHGASATRRAGNYELEGKKFLILEGFTILNYKPLLELCNLRYYFVLTYEECFSRRVYRLYDPPDVEGYFDQCVWLEHLRYRAEIEKDNRIKILDGTRPDSLDIVLADLKALGAKEILD